MRTATTLALFLSLATTAAYADSYDYDHPQTTNESQAGVAQHPEANSAKDVGEGMRLARDLMLALVSFMSFWHSAMAGQSPQAARAHDLMRYCT